MDSQFQPPSGNNRARTQYLLAGLTAAFLGLGGLFLANLWGRPVAAPKIPLVDPGFLATTPWRQTFADLIKAKEDLSDFDCYGCHEKNKPPVIKYDEKQNIIIPKEHSNLVMGHGSHNRNNLCWNCHNESNLLTLQARDGRELKLQDSPPLCGSCHGPTYHDWEAGAHGRTSGYWNRSQGEIQRLLCVNCHNPHAPRIPTRAPAPGPHSLHEAAPAAAKSEPTH